MSIWSRFTNVFRHGRLNRDLDAEQQYHVESRIEHLVRQGLSRAEAEREAARRFGNRLALREESRDVKVLPPLEDLVRDVRLGFRSLRRDRGFAAAVTGILALGIGTSVTMFSVLDAVVLRPLPYARPDELVRVSSHLMRQDQWDGSSVANFLDWRDQSRAIANMTFYRRTSVSVITYDGVDAAQRAREGRVGPEFFELLGTAPIAGRTFTRDEFDRADRVVVLSEGLWHEQFAGSLNALGRTMTIDGQPHTVVGVMPRTFQLPTKDTRFWRPFSVLPEWPKTKTIRDGDGIEVIGRLAPGVRLDEAAAEMRLIAARLRAYPVNENLDVRLMPLLDHLVGPESRRGVWFAFAAVASLLLIACFNVGGLVVARATRRRRELALRQVLGAARLRLVRQLLAEALSLWAVASVAGTALASMLIQLVVAYGPSALPRLDEASLDFSALSVAFAGGLVVVGLSWTLPSIIATGTDVRPAFATRDESSLPRHGLHDALIAGQIAGGLVLLVGAILFARSFMRAQSEDPGYPADELIIARFDLPVPAYPNRTAVEAFVQDARERLNRVPGVIGIGAITDFFIRRNAGQWVVVEGSNGRGPDARLAVEGVTPAFFTTIGTPFVEGRDFDERDYVSGAPPVFIVSEAFAHRFWPGQSAVGKRLVGADTPPKDGQWATVVGVIKDLRREGLDVSPILLGFIPAYPRGMDMTIRVTAGAERLIPEVGRQLRAIDQKLPIGSIATAGGRLSERIGSRRFESQLIVLFAVIALVLSAAGLYALLAYQVVLRRREIGIRSALGAERRSIIAMVVGHGARLALAGVAVGLVVAAGLARAIQSLLYETSAFDAGSYAAAAMSIVLTAILAAWVPARRAGGVSPMTVLRDQ
jgi:putative ABC transport system permease protein